jgi:nucleoside-diphosphate-sugar epimerase
VERIAITGAAGRIGSAVLPLLRKPEREFVLVDATAVEGAAPEDDVRRLDIADRAGLTAAFGGVETVVHLAGIPTEASWDDLLHANIDGTQAVLEAATAAGVRRVMLASSIHAAGMWTIADAKRADTLIPRPEGFYGVSKAAMEALGSMYADRFGLTVVSARICAFNEDPGDGHGPDTWFAPADAARLIEAVHALRDPGHHIVWGISADGAEVFGITDDQGIGFVPQERAPREVSNPLPGSMHLAAEAAEPRNPPGQSWS